MNEDRDREKLPSVAILVVMKWRKGFILLIHCSFSSDYSLARSEIYHACGHSLSLNPKLPFRPVDSNIEIKLIMDHKQTLPAVKTGDGP